MNNNLKKKTKLKKLELLRISEDIEILDLKNFKTTNFLENVEIFNVKNQEKILKKINKDTIIMDSRSDSWRKNLYIKINKYDEIRIVNKIEFCMSELILVQKDYHEFLVKANTTKTNKGINDLINELRLLKKRKNKLYLKCKSISHIQGLIDLRSVKN